MKNISFILLLFAMNIFSSCNKNPVTPAEQTGNLNVAVDAQSSFENDEVEVLIDGQYVINRRLTTNNLLGVCYLDGQVIATRNAGDHEITVNINNAITRTETFTLNNNLYIGVQYNRQKNEIVIVYSSQKFLYD